MRLASGVSKRPGSYRVVPVVLEHILEISLNNAPLVPTIDNIASLSILERLQCWRSSNVGEATMLERLQY